MKANWIQGENMWRCRGVVVSVAASVFEVPSSSPGSVIEYPYFILRNY
jgi:hypothetical protein